MPSAFVPRELSYPVPLDWLLDPSDPASRLRALRELFDRTDADPEVRDARAALMESAPVANAFSSWKADLAWGDLAKEDAPKGTAWMLSWLLQLGVPPRDQRVVQAARSLVTARQVRERAGERDWPVGGHSSSTDPGDTASCVTGDNLALALMVLGPIEENRAAVMWLLRSQRHDGGWLHCHRWSWTARGSRILRARRLSWPEETDPAIRSCRYGTYRAMRGLAALPEELRDPNVRKALTRGAEFFLARGVTGNSENPDNDVVPKVKSFNAGFHLLGTPVRQTIDMLAVARLLTDLGYGPDVRLARTVNRIFNLQTPDGWWKCESAGPGMWPTDEQEEGAPSKRITIDAIALLRRVARSSGVELRLR